MKNYHFKTKKMIQLLLILIIIFILFFYIKRETKNRNNFIDAIYENNLITKNEK